MYKAPVVPKDSTKPVTQANLVLSLVVVDQFLRRDQRLQWMWLDVHKLLKSFL